MKHPTIGRAFTHAIRSRKTWQLVGTAWLLGFSAVAIITGFGVLAGASPEAAAGYLRHVMLLLSVSAVSVMVAARTGQGYHNAMCRWERQRQARQDARHMRRAARQ